MTDPVTNEDKEINKFKGDMNNMVNDLVQRFEPMTRNPSMNIEVFKEYYLPILSGNVPEGTNYNPQDILNGWIDGVGSLQASVDLVDNNGEVIITIPPFINSGIIDAGNTDDMVNVSDFIEGLQIRNNHSNLTGQAFMDQHGKAVLNKITLENNTDAWKEVYRYFGIIGNDNAENANKSSDDVDIFEW